MENLIRLAYISRSAEAHKGLEHVLTITDQILADSIQFNSANKITGILCFSNDCYFQYLEGPKSAVELLYSKIEKDERHTDVKSVIHEPIADLAFATWHMKYIEDINLAMPLIKLHGHKHFSPYEFAENLFKDLIDYLSQKCAACKG